ncbi:MAG: hypothetical protein Q9165_004005 [Trypethelium subeluteriae]
MQPTLFTADNIDQPDNKDIAKFFGKNVTKSAMAQQMSKVRNQAKELETATSDDYEPPVRKGTRKRSAKNNAGTTKKVAKSTADNVVATSSRAANEENNEEAKDEDEDEAESDE